MLFRPSAKILRFLSEGESRMRSMLLVDKLNFSQLTRAPSSNVIFSMGGIWNCNSISVAADAFSPFSFSHRSRASFIVVAFCDILFQMAWKKVNDD
jgi:hypothetical protein